MNSPTTITLTFCERGENHIGNQMIGTEISKGLSAAHVRNLAEKFKDNQCELIELNTMLEEPLEAEDACVFVLRNALDMFLEEDSSVLLHTLLDLEWDSKVFSRRHKRVINKHARSNLIFAENSQTPCYEDGKGTVVSYKSIPLLEKLKDAILFQLFDNNMAENVSPIAEGNLYLHNKIHGIGWHGDSERKIVVGVRLGGEMPLKFAWFHRHRAVSKSYELMLSHGDVYVMSEKAVGSDWKRSSHYTLRHCAGAISYTKDK